jgi:hypothetical protein
LPARLPAWHRRLSSSRGRGSATTTTTTATTAPNMAAHRDVALLNAVLGSPARPGLEDLLGRVRGILLAKLRHDLARMVAAGEALGFPGAGASAGPGAGPGAGAGAGARPEVLDHVEAKGEAKGEQGGLTANQRLARAYRVQCEKVLGNAIAALEADGT